MDTQTLKFWSVLHKKDDWHKDLTEAKKNKLQNNEV